MVDSRGEKANHLLHYLNNLRKMIQWLGKGNRLEFVGKEVIFT